MPTPLLGSRPNPEAGKKLRAERVRVGLSTRAVQELSQRIAREKNNQEYYISHAWLTDAENGKFTPTIYKFYSLGLIYKCSCIDMMAFFGLDLLDVAREQRLVRLPHTHLQRIEPGPAGSEDRCTHRPSRRRGVGADELAIPNVWGLRADSGRGSAGPRSGTVSLRIHRA